MSPRLKMRHALTVIGLGLVLSFQNCSQTNFEKTEESYEANLPFAYSAKVDTISYMSCSSMNANPPDKRGYFSIRAGAYGVCNPADLNCSPFSSPISGLTLTNEFRTATQYYSNLERSHLFGMSTKNSNTFLSLSVRSTDNYQTPWKEGNIMAGEELDAMLPALDSGAVAGPLGHSSPGQMFNYFPGSQSQRLLEGSLRYYNFENTAKLTRDTLNRREALLVMGFSNSADPLDTGLRFAEQEEGQPTLPTNRAYGTGYFLGFSLPYGYTAGEQRVLSSNGVEEIDLSTNQATNNGWECSASYQFMVVRPEDKAAGRVNCDATIDIYANANQQAALNAIRRVLRVEDWFVDVARRCVMPKRTGDYCYGPLNGRTIQYGLASCINDDTRMCPHFVSVCVKR